MTSPFRNLLYKMVSARVCLCVRACVIEIKLGTLRAACFFDIRVKNAYKMATFIAAKGLFNLSNNMIDTLDL